MYGSPNTRHTFTHQTRLLRSFLKNITLKYVSKLYTLLLVHFCQHYHMIYKVRFGLHVKLAVTVYDMGIHASRLVAS